MRKLVQGIVDFRRKRRPDYAETFSRLALRQKPDALYISCSDSRVQANVFASTEPGDLFVVRNPGNLVSPAGPDGKSLSDESEASAIEFALDALEVDRKSTRLNSSHLVISYAVFCLKKKKQRTPRHGWTGCRGQHLTGIR